MASMTIRNLDPELKARLRVRAAHNGRSMEEEARVILRDGVSADPPRAAKLGGAIHRRFRTLGGVDLELPAREPSRAPPRLR